MHHFLPFATRRVKIPMDTNGDFPNKMGGNLSCMTPTFINEFETGIPLTLLQMLVLS